MRPVGDQATDRSIRVVLAASDPSLSRLLADGLDDAGFVVAAVETSASEAIEAVCLHQPDVFVVATDLAGSAVIATARIGARTPVTKVVVAAGAPDDDDCLTYLIVGASGYVGIGAGSSSVAAAIHGVVRGEAVVPPAAQRRLLDELREQLA